MAEDETDVEPAWMSLMAEAGVSPGLRRFHTVLWYVLLLLSVALAVLVVVGLLRRRHRCVVGLALFGSAAVVMVAAFMHRQYLIAKVRWLDGTVTFHTVEPAGVGEDGQYVVCQIALRPPTNHLTLASRRRSDRWTLSTWSSVPPCAASSTVPTVSRCCAFDPYAKPDTAIPFWPGRLQFHKA